MKKTALAIILLALAACGDNLDSVTEHAPDAGTTVAIAPTEQVPDQCVGPDCADAGYATCDPPDDCSSEEALTEWATCALAPGECVQVWCEARGVGERSRMVCR